MQKVWFGAALVAAFLLGFTLYRTLAPVERSPAIEGFLWPAPKQLTAFELTDHQGQPLDLSNLRGRWTLWYFGYTHCPDVCPQTLSVLQGVDEVLTAAGTQQDMQYLFVSVDPQRDTEARLAEYIPYFGASLTGATGSLEQVVSLTSQLGVFFVHNEPDDKGVYRVDHTSAILLTDPKQRLVGSFRHPQVPATIARSVQAIRSAIGKSD